LTFLHTKPGVRASLNRGVFLPIIALVLVAAALIAYSNYRIANAQLEARIETLARNSALLFQDLLWHFDLETIQTLLNEQVEFNAVTGARVTDGETLNLQAGNLTQSQSAYTVSRPLLRVRDGRVSEIGVLTFESTRAPVWKVVRTRVITALLVATGAILATTLLIHKLLNRTLITPVLKISNGLRNWSGDWRDFRIDLGRARDGREDDELDELVASIHGMRDHILRANESVVANERRLVRAAQIAGIGYSSFDVKTGQYVACDENFAAMIGHTVNEMLAVNVFDDIIPKRIHPDDVEAARTIGTVILHEGIAHGLFRVANRSGEYRHIRQIFEVDEPTEGKPRLVHTVAQDLTEINRLQSNLLQAQKVEAIGNLTGGVAHDFNNLLAIVSGNLELLLDDIQEPSARDYIETCLNAVGRGATLTRQLLAFARKQPLSPVVLDPARLIRESEALLRSSVGEAIELEVVADGGLWHTEADKPQLEAAILNLVINARDAMPDGGKLTIEVGNARLDREYASWHDEVEPGQYVCIAITDSGNGMAPEMIGRVFEPFFTTKKFGKGTGLGLPMVFGFAKQSGGHLKVYSELGRGTTVKLYLPRANAPSSPVAPDRELVAAHRFSGLHVFLVEDDESLRQTYVAQLGRLGCVVHAAADATTAFNLARKVPKVDLILCDVILPGGMKGPQVVEKLSKTYPDAAVVFMSGFTENSIIHHGRLDEGVIMLQKPFTMKDLVLAVSRATGNA